jgi:hypothetical protein
MFLCLVSHFCWFFFDSFKVFIHICFLLSRVSRLCQVLELLKKHLKKYLITKKLNEKQNYIFIFWSLK